MNKLRVSMVTALCVVVLLPITFGCSSSRNRATRSMTVSAFDDGNGLTVTLSEPLASSVLEGVFGSEFECGADLDADVEDLLRRLDRGGRGSRATIRGADGSIKAWRSGRSLEMRIANSDGGGLEIEMPWAVAACLIDGSASLSARDAGSIRVKLTGSEGGAFEIAVR